MTKKETRNYTIKKKNEYRMNERKKKVSAGEEIATSVMSKYKTTYLQVQKGACSENNENPIITFSVLKLSSECLCFG